MALPGWICFLNAVDSSAIQHRRGRGGGRFGRSDSGESGTYDRRLDYGDHEEPKGMRHEAERLVADAEVRASRTRRLHSPGPRRL